MPGDGRRAACVAAGVGSHDCHGSGGPVGVPIASATLSFRFGYRCSSAGGSDCYSCLRSLVRLNAPIGMKAH